MRQQIQQWETIEFEGRWYLEDQFLDKLLRLNALIRTPRCKLLSQSTVQADRTGQAHQSSPVYRK